MIYNDVISIIFWSFLIIGSIILIIKKSNYKKKQTIPHKCEHCENTIYLHPEHQELINKGGTIECGICHKWTH
jgi:hypothetical protein